MKFDTAILQAHLDGQMSALRKEPATANPHTLNTCFSRAWSRGWRAISGDVQGSCQRKRA